MIVCKIIVAATETIEKYHGYYVVLLWVSHGAYL